MLVWTFRSVVDAACCPRAVWLHSRTEHLRASASRHTFAALALTVASRVVVTPAQPSLAKFLILRVGSEYRAASERNTIIQPTEDSARRVMAWVKRIGAESEAAARQLAARGPFTADPIDTCDVVRADDDFAIAPPPGASVLTLVSGEAMVVAVLPDGCEQRAADAIRAWAHFALGAEAKTLFVTAQPVKTWPSAEVLMQLGAQAQGVSDITRGDMPAKAEDALCRGCRFVAGGECMGDAR